MCVCVCACAPFPRLTTGEKLEKLIKISLLESENNRLQEQLRAQTAALKDVRCRVKMFTHSFVELN
jgi:hypothetical protein